MSSKLSTKDARGAGVGRNWCALSDTMTRAVGPCVERAFGEQLPDDAEEMTDARHSIERLAGIAAHGAPRMIDWNSGEAKTHFMQGIEKSEMALETAEVLARLRNDAMVP